MPRALAILKYVPAVLCALLVVAWVATQFIVVTIHPVADFDIESKLAGSSFAFVGNCRWRFPPSNCFQVEFSPGRPWYFANGKPVYLVEPTPLGKLKYDGYYLPNHWIIVVPIPLLLCLAFPMATGPFSHFRFPLWSYFAWTALIAAELAFYLR